MNQLDQLLIIYLTTPASNFYLSKFMMASKNPQLEPYEASAVDVGSFDVFGQKIGVSLKNLKIQGLTNIQIEKQDGKARIEVTGDTVTFYAIRPNTEAPSPGASTDLIINAQLIFTVDGESSPSVPIDITVKSGQLIGTFTATGDPINPDSVNITFKRIELNTLEKSSNIIINLNGLKSFLKDPIQEYLQKESTLKSVIQEFSSQLNSQSILNSISGAGTTAAKEALRKL